MYYYPVAMITGIPIRSVNNCKHSIIICQHRGNTVQFIIIIWLYYFTANKTVNMSCNILKPPAAASASRRCLQSLHSFIRFETSKTVHEFKNHNTDQ